MSTPSGASSAAFSTTVFPVQSAGRDLERREQHRRVPRDDRAHHPDGLAPRIAQQMLAERQGLALELAREAAEVAEDVRRQSRFRPGLGTQCVAGLGGDGARELLGLRLDGIGDPEQHPAPFARRHVAPARERLGRGLHRSIDVLGAGARYMSEDVRFAGFRTGMVSPEALSTRSPARSIRAGSGTRDSCMVAVHRFGDGGSVPRRQCVINRSDTRRQGRRWTSVDRVLSEQPIRRARPRPRGTPPAAPTRVIVSQSSGTRARSSPAAVSQDPHVGKSLISCVSAARPSCACSRARCSTGPRTRNRYGSASCRSSCTLFACARELPCTRGSGIPEAVPGHRDIRYDRFRCA